VTAGLHYTGRYGRETGERDLRPQQHRRRVSGEHEVRQMQIATGGRSPENFPRRDRLRVRRAPDEMKDFFDAKS